MPCEHNAAATSWIFEIPEFSRFTDYMQQHYSPPRNCADGQRGQDRLTMLAGSCRGLGSGAWAMPAEGGVRGEEGVVSKARVGAGPCPPQTNRETGHHCSEELERKWKPRFQRAGNIAGQLFQCPCFQIVSSIVLIMYQALEYYATGLLLKWVDWIQWIVRLLVRAF